MKKVTILGSAILFLLAMEISAQQHHMGSMNQSGDGPEMQGNMMATMRGMMCPMQESMMNHDMPMQKYMMMINMLPDLKNKLSLSQMQFEKLIDLQSDFKKRQVDYTAQLKKNRMKLQEMLENDASPEEIRKQMGSEPKARPARSSFYALCHCPLC